MNGALKRPVRVGVRLLWLATELGWAAINFIPRVLLLSGFSSLEARARWVRAGCRRVLRIFAAEFRVAGPIPRSGLLVSNHLSYLDILALGALTPSIFVAKRELKGYPVLGWLARLGGTLFADRERRTQVRPLAEELRTALDQKVLVILFPEGTSSDGRTVLPFKSALLEPATNCSHGLSVSRIEYRLADGDVAEEVCYWKDMILVPHLLNLLSRRRVDVSVRFAAVQPSSTNRKELAKELHAEVLKLIPDQKRYVTHAEK